MSRIHYLLNRTYREGLAAARQCRAAALMLQATAVGIVIAYYQHPPFAEVLNELARFKADTGWSFALFSTALAGGLFPVIVQTLLRAPDWREGWRHLPFLLVFWASQGLLVDAFYYLQALWFGDQATIQTIALKTVVDMLGFAPLLAVPMIVIAYQWKDCGYSIKKTRERFAQEGFLAQFLPIMIMNWAIWVPAVIAIYCFPLPLQLPLQNLTLALWTILLSVLAKREK